VEGSPHLGWPSASTDNSIERFPAYQCRKWQVNVEYQSGRENAILTEQLNMYRLQQNLFPRVMSQKWKEQCVAIGQEIVLWEEDKNTF
jgi:hypothetical protein